MTNNNYRCQRLSKRTVLTRLPFVLAAATTFLVALGSGCSTEEAPTQQTEPECREHDECASDSYCDGGVCNPTQQLGATCVAGTECASGHCSDDVCCDAACDGGCNACTAAEGAADDGVCTLLGDGAPSTDDVCSPYTCDGLNHECVASCTDDTDCSATHQCIGNSCVPRFDNGESCELEADCKSGICTEGVCCDGVCDGACESCNVEGSVGTCSTLADGVAAKDASCEPYLCDGTSPACPDTCAGAEDCTSGLCTDQNECKAACFGGTVTNASDPTSPGSGINGLWGYYDSAMNQGYGGWMAGDKMCQAIGADHVCTYEEVAAAEAIGENLPDGSYWLHRVNATVMVGGVSSPPGGYGRCNDWNYQGGPGVADGEYVEIAGGAFTYYFDEDTEFNVVSQRGFSCHHERAIICCTASCSL